MAPPAKKQATALAERRTGEQGRGTPYVGEGQACQFLTMVPPAAV